jgi:hypothetical protein
MKAIRKEEGMGFQGSDAISSVAPQVGLFGLLDVTYLMQMKMKATV